MGLRTEVAPSGSSQRMRGAHRRPDPADHGEGIIPAYAGSTGIACPLSSCRKDHPRVFGEHTATNKEEINRYGSSLRMRGARLVLPASGAQPGIIPAYAGSTTFPSLSLLCCRDHPRVCGEHERSLPVRHGQHGIIPAYAGSTSFMLDDSDFVKDHSRVCGEHQSAYEDEK